MSDAALAAIDFSRYQKLIGGLRIGVQAIIVYGCAGDRLWANGDLSQISVDPKQLNYVQIAGSQAQYAAVEDDAYLYQYPLQEFSQNKIGEFCIVLQAVNRGAESHLDSDVHAVVCTVLKNIAECIQGEFQLLSELEQMASELSERYNELNMVYGTEDQVQGNAEAPDLLQALVRNCIQYLDVDYVVILLPGKNLTITHAKAKVDERLTYQADEFIDTQILPWVREHMAPLVLNNKGDFQAIEPMMAPTWKFMASPVMDVNQQLDGILCSIKSDQKADYSNSDRNLLEAMSRKASKIIQSNYDALTGLINRNGFESILEHSLQQAGEAQVNQCVIIVNLDQLQIVNDVAGHAAGDELIRRVGSLLYHQVDEKDKVARLGGDVFGILFVDANIRKAKERARRLRIEVSKMDYRSSSSRFNVTVSIGLVAITPEMHNVASILSSAELACEAAKEAGRNTERVYLREDAEMAHRKEQMLWANRTQSALREDRFELHVQPIQRIDIAGTQVHYEVLLRMRADRGRLIAPGYFMPAAERFIMMPLVDRWVINASLELITQNLDFLAGLGSHFAINLSGQSVSQEGFLVYMIDQIERSEIPAEMLCFEITETVAIKNVQLATDFINQVKTLGCRFSLDDFGTGTSSYTYLRSLPVDYLKIDGSFVKDIVVDPVSKVIVSSIQQVANVMGLETIAEFVENTEICDVLEDMGINYAQGYGIGKPRPFRKEIETLRKNLAEIST